MAVMANDLSIGADGTASLTMNYNASKIRYPTLLPGFPDSFYPKIGLVALSWSQYEILFNRLLAALVQFTNNQDEPNWKILDYRRRKAYCRKLINLQFRVRKKLKSYLLQVLDDSAVAQNKRNLIVHGKAECEIDNRDPAKPAVFMRAEGRLAGKIIAMRFSVEDLETLAYEILHIAGRLNINPDTPLSQLSSSDKRVLAELLSLIPPEHSILPTLPDPL